ncbi:MAG: Gfo/Idh/MocA family oxidoreductase [Clostridia bacterium]|nr:Gfo/Idh/MocA family oxidoreductase [Clostridia bacterium]
MYKVGLIGCGFMGSMHADCYAALADRVKIVAVADLVAENAENFSQKFDAKIYADAEDLIKNADVDYVDICLPTYLHCAYAKMAMQQGSNVFIEKPLCLTTEQAEELLAVQKETGKMVQVGQVIRFWDEYVWLKEAKDSGKFGDLKFITMHRYSARPTWAWNNWLHNNELSGGMAFDMHIHDADYLRYLLGEPKSIKSTNVKEEGALTDYISTLYEYDGVMANVDCCWNFPAEFPFTMYFCARFEKATVVHNSAAGEFAVYYADGGKEDIKIEKGLDTTSSSGGNISSLGGYFNELKYFVDRLDNPSLPDIASLEEGAKSVALVLSEIHSDI